jgi:hypothetical protein
MTGERDNSHARTKSRFNRRNLAAPAFAALVLLAACGGGEDPNELASNGSSDSAEFPAAGESDEKAEAVSNDQAQTKSVPVPTGEADSDAIIRFRKFYNSRFKGLARIDARDTLWTQYVAQGGTSYTKAELLEPLKFQAAWSWLTPTRKGNFRTNLKTALYKTRASVPGVSEGYTKAQLDSYISWGKTMSAETRNELKQHQQDEWHYLNFFLDTLDPTALSTHTTKSNEAEVVDDNRYLSGTVDDEIEYYSEDGKNFYRVVMGNKRAPVERLDLELVYKWPVGFIRYDVSDPKTTYARDSDERPQPTGSVYSATGLTTKLDYVYTEDVRAGVEAYIERDLDKHGNLRGMTKDQSRALMRRQTERLVRETGQVYSSYVMAQYLSRAVATAVSMVGKGFIAGKNIDLSEFAVATMEGAVASMPASTSQTTKNINFIVFSAAVTNAAALTTTFLTVAESIWAKTRGDSLATSKDLIPDIVTGFLIVPRAGATWWPYKLLWDLTTETDPTVCKENVDFWLPVSFPTLDLVSSISDMITISYKKDDYASNNLFYTAIANSAINFIIGTYGFAHHFMKAPYWTFERKWQDNQYAIRPVALATLAQAANCALYLSAASQYYEVTQHDELRVGR